MLLGLTSELSNFWGRGLRDTLGSILYQGKEGSQEA